MAITIKPVRCGSLKEGDRFVEVDDDNLTTAEAIADGYDIEALAHDASTVLDIWGHADIGKIKYTSPWDGQEYTTNADWDQFVWLVEEN